MNIFAHNPSLDVELGAAYVLACALVSRVMLRRFGIPSIVSLLILGLAAGPSGFDFLRLNLTEPATRALLSLAVVVVLFEATLRMEFVHLPKRVLALLAILGPAAALAAVPRVGHALGLTPVVISMTAAICVVTGPTVTGPLLARLRLRSRLSHLLETEGLALDALGVVVAAAIFTSFTARAQTPGSTVWLVAVRLGVGILIGLAIGFIGGRVMGRLQRLPSDISKVLLLVLGIGTYALAELASHESGLSAVVACGMVLDFSKLPHERLLRSFKEDLSMLALSTVFVLLASQIQLSSMWPLVGAGAAIAGTLIAARIVVVLLSTLKSTYTLKERVFMMTVFPRGIVAVSLATYYATQLPAWGIRGGSVLAGVCFLVIIFTVAASTIGAIVTARVFRLAMPSILILGISSTTVELARRFLHRGYLVLLADDEERRVEFGRSHDIDSEFADSPARITELLRGHGASVLILGRGHRWPRLDARDLPTSVRRFSLEEPRAGWMTIPDDSAETLDALFAARGEPA